MRSALSREAIAVETTCELGKGVNPHDAPARLDTAVLATPRAGDAQVLVNESTGTPVPLAFVYLNAGTTYYFTTAVTSPLVPGGATQNPVLTLMSDWNVRVAGAQFCGSFDFTRACFTYTPTTSNLYMLVLHGDNTLSPGRATVWQSQSAYCTNSSCSDLGATGEVRIWNDVAFGGDTVTVTAPTSGRVHYHTLHRPGNAIFHTLFARTTTAANFPERISRIAFNGWSGTGRIRGTVKFDTTNPTTFGIDGTREWVVGPSFPDQLGAVRLVRNRWFESGADGDGDGLSYQVELDLDTCDEAFDGVRPGVLCSQLHIECQSGGDPSQCHRLLRDTDSDGLRDDLEVYGFDSASVTSKDLRFPQWGADPRHMDVFVEMDFMLPKSRITLPPFDVCTDYEWGDFGASSPRDVRWLGSREYPRTAPVTGLYRNFFDSLESVYEQSPATLNADGTSGISVHFDVGVTNPDPLDTRWGSWGGGNTCVQVEYANIQPSDPIYCGRDEAYNNDMRCNCPSNVCFDPERRPMFRYAVDGHDGGGQALGPKYAAGFTAVHVHELAHTLGLDHGGPYGSLGAVYEGEANLRPTYPSRISYLHQDYGGLRGEGDTNSGGIFSEMSFSDASWATRPFSTRNMLETNPIAGANLILMRRSPQMFGDSSGPGGNLGGGWHRVLNCTTPGACNVDWNLDDSINGSSDNRLMMFRQDKRLSEGTHSTMVSASRETPISCSSTIIWSSPTLAPLAVLRRGWRSESKATETATSSPTQSVHRSRLVSRWVT
ncbi:MAG: hypothetical protein MUE69_06560 [Myxococcota bacterium]|nr:hypothetical protein [Myxococcota bacterium]